MDIFASHQGENRGGPLHCEAFPTLLYRVCYVNLVANSICAVPAGSVLQCDGSERRDVTRARCKIDVLFVFKVKGQKQAEIGKILMIHLKLCLPDVQIVVQPGSLAARNYLSWQK